VPPPTNFTCSANAAASAAAVVGAGIAEVRIGRAGTAILRVDGAAGRRTGTTLRITITRVLLIDCGRSAVVEHADVVAIRRVALAAGRPAGESNTCPLGTIGIVPVRLTENSTTIALEFRGGGKRIHLQVIEIQLEFLHC